VLFIQIPAAVADEVSQTAYAYFDAGRYKEAYPLFTRMVNRDASDLRAQYYLAVVCQRVGQIHNAIQMYVRIVSLAPKSNEARYSKAALDILAHRNITPPKIPAAAAMPPLGSSGGESGAKAANVSDGATLPDRDLEAAQSQAAELIANAKRQADALDAKADAIEKDMASVMRPKGYVPAYTKADIDAETADLRKQSAEIRARGQRESDDVLSRAKLRHDATSHH
jgi:tetratricopeptide (TPR) repeat protein